MKTFIIEEPVYRTEVLVVYDCPLKELETHLKKMYNVTISDDLKEEDSAETTIGTVLTYKRKPWRVVWVRRLRRGNAEDLGALAHELYHLVTHVLHDKGIPILKYVDDDRWCGDEAAAYLYESYFVSALKKIRAKK